MTAAGTILHGTTTGLERRLGYTRAYTTCHVGAAMRLEGFDLLRYLWHRLGCSHPFRVSRLAALVELEWLREKGERLSNLRYVAGPGTFYIEGVSDLVGKDPCFEKHEDKRCVEYRCEPPKLPPEVKALADRVIEEAQRLDDMELNRRVVSHPLYEKLVGGEAS